MSFWLPPSVPWPLGPGVRRENDEGRKARGPGAAVVPLPRNGPQRSELSASTMLGFMPLSFPPRKRGPRSRGSAAATRRTSAQWAFGQYSVRVLLKKQHPPCCGAFDGSMSFWLPFSAPWSLGPGVRRENDEGRKARGPGAAVVPLPRSGPQCSELSAGRRSGSCPLR